MLVWPKYLQAKSLEWIEKSSLVSLVFPNECAFCQCAVEGGQRLCEACLQQLVSNRYCCQRCAMPLPSVLPNDQCSRCRDHHWHFSNILALGHYQGKLREAVILCKKLRVEYLRYALARELANRIRERFPDMQQREPLIVPVPYHWSRTLARTASTANSLAELLSQHSGWPVATRMVRRIRRTGKQGMLSLVERQQNVRGAFQIVGSPSLSGRHLLIVDDVVTSGATANELAKQLRRTKPLEISVVALARATG